VAAGACCEVDVDGRRVDVDGLVVDGWVAEGWVVDEDDPLGDCAKAVVARTTAAAVVHRKRVFSVMFHLPCAHACEHKP
jgi:hypothetical protein